MPPSQNPYIAGVSVGNTQAFVGRADLLEDVLGALGDANIRGIVLHGQRRIGKTSILHQLAALLPRDGGPEAIYFDLQHRDDMPVGEMMAALSLDIAEKLKKISEGRSLAVLFDEFEALANRPQNAEALRALCKLLDNTPRLRLVIVVHNLEGVGHFLPLFKSLQTELVTLLDRDEADALVRLSER